MPITLEDRVKFIVSDKPAQLNPPITAPSSDFLMDDSHRAFWVDL